MGQFFPSAFGGLGGFASSGVDYGVAIANTSGGTSTQDATAADYLLTKTAASGWDNSDWNSAALTGAFDMRFRPRLAANEYSRVGFASVATGRTITNTGTNSVYVFFDEFGVIRLCDAAGGTIWQNGVGNVEPNFTDNEYFWLPRDASNIVTLLRGGTGTKASATAVATANVVLAAGTYSGTRYFFGQVFTLNKSIHAKVIV